MGNGQCHVKNLYESLPKEWYPHDQSQWWQELAITAPLAATIATAMLDPDPESWNAFNWGRTQAVLDAIAKDIADYTITDYKKYYESSWVVISTLTLDGVFSAAARSIIALGDNATAVPGPAAATRGAPPETTATEFAHPPPLRPPPPPAFENIRALAEPLGTLCKPQPEAPPPPPSPLLPSPEPIHPPHPPVSPPPPPPDDHEVSIVLLICVPLGAAVVLGAIAARVASCLNRPGKPNGRIARAIKEANSIIAKPPTNTVPSRDAAAVSTSVSGDGVSVYPDAPTTTSSKQTEAPPSGAGHFPVVLPAQLPSPPPSAPSSECMASDCASDGSSDAPSPRGLPPVLEELTTLTSPSQPSLHV